MKWYPSRVTPELLHKFFFHTFIVHSVCSTRPKLFDGNVTPFPILNGRPSPKKPHQLSRGSQPVQQSGSSVRQQQHQSSLPPSSQTFGNSQRPSQQRSHLSSIPNSQTHLTRKRKWHVRARIPRQRRRKTTCNGRVFRRRAIRNHHQKHFPHQSRRYTTMAPRQFAS